MNKKTALIVLSALLFTSVAFSEDKKEPTKKEEPVLTRVETLQKELNTYQAQYKQVLDLKPRLELKIAETSGKLQEAILNEQKTEVKSNKKEEKK